MNYELRIANIYKNQGTINQNNLFLLLLLS